MKNSNPFSFNPLLYNGIFILMLFFVSIGASAQNFENITITGIVSGNATDNTVFAATSATIPSLAFIRAQRLSGNQAGQFYQSGDNILYYHQPDSNGPQNVPDNVSRIRLSLLQADGVTLIPVNDFRFIINDIDGPDNEGLDTNCDSGVRFIASDLPTNLTIDDIPPDLSAFGTINESNGPGSRVMFEFNDVNFVEFNNYADDGFLKVFDLNQNNFAINTPGYSVCTKDSDGDGLGDDIDIDDDDDGILDVVESNGNDPNGDADGDGLPNFLDTEDNSGDGVAAYNSRADNSKTDYTDLNSDGQPDVYEASQDDDDKPNHLDLDSDGDGIPDNIEAQSAAGYIAPTGIDSDNDGLDDAYEPTNGIVPINTDGGQANPDAISDFIDLDSDNDGVSDTVEAFDTNGDNVPETVASGNDTDEDGIDDNFDLNPGGYLTRPNAATNNGQTAASYPDDDNPGGARDWRDARDTDGDGVQDNADLDDDNDGLLDLTEYAGNDPFGDEDGDGTQNYSDNRRDIGTGDGSTTVYTDSNNDGIPDAYDFDGDGIPNHLDLDSDNDGIPDNIEGQSTLGYIAPNGDAAGNNGVDSAYGTGIIPRNSEGTDTPDFLDLDSDNEGGNDTNEAGLTLSGNVGANGLDSNSETADDYFDANGSFDDTQNDNFADADNDLNFNGDVDYRDATFDDNDSDGVSDDADLDDDNDGILDSVECTDYSAAEGDFSSAFNTVSTGQEYDQILTKENNSLSVTYKNRVSATGTIAPFTENVNASPNQLYARNTPITYMEPRPGADYDITFSNAIGVEFGITDIDNGAEEYMVEVFDENDVILDNPLRYLTTTFQGTSGTYPGSVTTVQYTDLGSELTFTADATSVTIAPNFGSGSATFTRSRSAFFDFSNVTVSRIRVTNSGSGGTPGMFFNGINNCPDSDSDGIPDFKDLDSDNDGIPDTVEAQPTDTYNAPGAVDPITGIPAIGSDTDGIDTLENTDGTDRPDYLDVDSDNDGLNDINESGNGALDTDDDGRTDGNVGTNGLANSVDNGDDYTDPDGTLDDPTTLPNVQFNASPEVDYRDDATDNDADGVPDATDPDDDNDGVLDVLEGADGTDPTGDADGDGVPNFTDTTDNGGTGDGSPTDYTDADSNGIPDVYDFDGDGVPNHLDLDSDNDGIPDNIESQSTKNYVAPNGDAATNNGLDTAYTGDFAPVNTDGDDNPDFLDLDSDNEGGSDTDEEGLILSGNFGTNGLDANYESADDYADVNGTFDDTQADNFNDTDGDINSAIGEVDYRDAIADEDGDGDGVPDRIDLDDDNDGVDDAIECSYLYCAETLVNGSFEEPVTSSGTFQLLNEDIVPGWETTATDGLIEFWDSGFQGVPATDGDQFIELNANQASTLFQTLCISPGSTITWRVDHRGRAGVDVANVEIGPSVATTVEQQVMSDGNTTWGNYSGSYVVPDGQNETVFAIVTVSATGSASVGNFVDNVLITVAFPPGCIDGDNDSVFNKDDEDSDNDGIPDSVELNGFDPQADLDGDGVLAYFDDNDNDPTVGNTDNKVQPEFDTDGDGIPNFLDLDSDNDGIADVIEAGGSDPENDGIIGSGLIVDTDGDGMSDIVDPDNGGTPLPVPNSDGNANDGADYLDIDSDDDGIPDNVEGQTTAGYVPPTGTDSDDDGIDDAYDSDVTGDFIVPVNTDGPADALPDYLDTDSDEDGISDTAEAGYTAATNTNDTDADGLLDAYDDVVGNDVNDDIDDANPTFLLDTDGDVAADGNNAIPLINDLDYRDNDQAPIATDDVGNYNPGTASEPIDVVANDTTGDPVLPETVSIVGGTDTDGDANSTLDQRIVIGEGTWNVDAVTGEVTFTPEAGFTGNPTEIQYTVQDAEGNTSNQATITVSNCLTIPAEDCDGDGNINQTDPNPDTATAVDDNTSADVGVPMTFNILTNDDFLPGSTITDLGTGTVRPAGLSIDQATGEITYTAIASEDNTTVTLDYQVCNGAVCATATVFISIPACADADGDNICDADETAATINDPCEPRSNPDWQPQGTNDCDADGLTDDEELTAGTDAFNADSDGDGINDGQEVNTDNTDPLDDCDSNGGTALGGSDCDTDGLTNDEETTGVDDVSTPANPNGTTTDPANADSDGDGILDGQETLDGTDPNDSCDSNGGTALGTDDCDGDGLTNDEETSGIDNVATAANPNGIATDPNVSDTDGDGISDGQEALDGTNPNDSCDSTGGTPIGTDDCDNDGLTNDEELTGVNDPSTSANPNGTTTDPNDDDSDDDGISDGQETLDGTDPNDDCSSFGGTTLGTSDCDNDGLTNDEETTGVDDASTPANPNGTTTDPKNEDTDGDGISDGQETVDGTDPNNDCDAIGGTPLATSDCDGDGNPNGTDPNPNVGTAVDDNTSADVGVAKTINILTNDDFLPGSAITITGGTAVGTATINQATGEITYTATAAEDGNTVTLNYEVCNGGVCDTAILSIAIPICADSDGDNICDVDETAATLNDPCEPRSNPDWQPQGTNDCDADGLTDAEEATAGTDPFNADSDGDEINDGQEVNVDLTGPLNDCSSVNGTPLTTSDCDGDGLTTEEESLAGTDPNTADTDGDGINDGQEVADGSDPRDDCSSNGGTPLATSDCDNDGLTNGDEATAGTDPLDNDSDNDGILDGQEVNVDGTDPLNDCSSNGGTPLGASDCDNDGLTNDEETTGVDDASTPANPSGNTTDPNNDDTDGDGISDGQEAIDGTDPNDDCDANGGTPLATSDCDGDGNPNGTDPNPTAATAVDDSASAEVGVPQTINVLSNDDFLPGSTITITGGTAIGAVTIDQATGEITYTATAAEDGNTVTLDYQVCNGSVCATATIQITIPNCTDSDGDNVCDADETAATINDPCQPISDSNWRAQPTNDCDTDGLTDSEEATAGTDPYDSDSDGDGINDGQEVTDNTDPLDDCESNGGTPLGTSDCDNDGLTNDEETTGVDDAATTADPDGTTTDPNDDDSDDDGISDGQETIDGTDPNDSCESNGGTPLGTDDCDNDGLTNDEETTGVDNPSTTADPNGTTTDPNDDDSDDDGISDGQETLDSTDPNDSCESNGGTTLGTDDCDNDGLTNDEETTGVDDPSTTANPNGTTTDPNDDDSDDDGISDGQETLDGTDPNDDCDSTGGIPLGNSDCDGDGLTTNDETTAGTDPDNPDTDGDGLTDGEEVLNVDDPSTPDMPSGTSDPINACDPDSGNSLCDNDGDGLTNEEEAVLGTDPNSADTDGDGINDGQEVTDGTDPLEDCDSVNGTPLPGSDCDADGLGNDMEAEMGTDPNNPDSDGDGLTDGEEVSLGTDPNNPDSDGDGINDGQEVSDATNPLDDCDSDNGTPLPDSDCDADGLTNAEENNRGTDPDNADTDGDGINDGREINDGTNPTDGCSSNGGTPPADVTCDITIETDLIGPGINGGIFKITNIESYTNNTVRIYNRWGVLVYETNGYDNERNAFRGISNGRVTISKSDELPVGVYFYIIDYMEEAQQEVRTKNGYLYVTR